MMKITVSCSPNSDIDCRSCYWGIHVIQGGDSSRSHWCDMSNGWGDRHWHSCTISLEGRASTCEVEGWKREIAQHTHTYIHVHTILGTPPVPSPLTPKPLARFPVPCFPHWEPLPLFWTNFTVQTPNLCFYSSPVLQLASPKQARPNGTVHTHTHPDKDKQAHCDTQAPDRNMLKAVWSFKWPSGYSGWLHFLAFHLKLAFWTQCFGRMRADWLAGSRFTLGETNRLKNHKVL